MKKRSASRDAFFNPRVFLGFALSSAGVCMALLALSINSSSTAVAAGASNAPTIIHSYHNDRSPAMRDVDPWPVQRVQEHEASENPKIRTGLHKDKADLVIQKGALLGQLAPSIPAPILTFAGIPFPGVSCNCAPPDTNGEVGLTQYVQMVNTGYQVFDKATGASVFGPASINSVWTGFGGVCQTSGFGDPVVLYDQLANRWIISQFAGTSIPTDECIAVSTTSDATGTYNRYAFHIGSNFFDYEKISVWPDAYYMSANIFNSSGTAYLGPQAYAMNRTAMLAGSPATLIAMPILGSSFPPMLPADIEGSILPTAGAPNSFVLWPDTGTYRVYHFSVGTPFGTGATFSLFGSSPAAGFTEICPTTRDCVPALNASTPGNKMDSLGDRPMFRLVYRKFADGHESLVGNYTVNATGRAGVRWFELRGVTAGPVTTFQDSTYAPADTVWRWMGSIAMNGQGDIALGFSASDATIHPQLRYTGRLASDPINTMAQGEGTIFAGAGSQTDTSNRWGDYSDMTVDPVDDCTFWYTNEYYDTNSSFNWRTRVGSFRVGTCGGGGSANLVSAASRVTHGSAGAFDIAMPLTGVSGVEDRDTSTYTAVFTFDTTVTSGMATVTAGTATAGAPSFSGNEMRVPLTGVANVQTVTIHISGVNGGSAMADVPFSFLIADENANRSVDKPDYTDIKNQIGQPVTSSNFRSDVIPDGTIGRDDAAEVRTHKRESL